VIISAAFSGAQRQAKLAVTIPIRVYAVNLLPNVMGGRTVTGTVYMNESPMGNVVVALASSDPTVAAVPASVTVTASSDRTEFMVSTASVAVPTAVTISATSSGVTKSAVLTVNPSADIEAPDTTVTSVIDGNETPLGNGSATLSNVATIAFAGTDNAAVAGFECRLDGGSFTSCSSPSKRSALAIGRHDFEVRAVDTSNNHDGTPALYTWSVDSPPDTTITSAVDRNGNPVPNGGTIRSNAITFSFTATDNVGVKAFECSLDSATFTACVSPATYTGGSRASHTFRVRAVDTNGFRDATPASFTWSR
jgi:hypothetical protein